MMASPRKKQLEELLGPGFVCFGHRGMRELVPENTLKAFQLGLQSTRYFELDTMLTKDEVLVVIHDETLNRTTNGEGLVREKTFEEIQTLDAGSYFSPKFAGTKVPSLESLFYELPVSTIFDIEVKSNEDENERKLLAKHLVTLLSRCKANHRVFITSFDPFLLEAVKRENPALLRGQLLEEGDSLKQDFVSEPDLFLPNYKGLTKDTMIELSSMSYSVIPYTMNDPKDWERMLPWGLRGLITDRPDLFLNFRKA
ncbi:glycerophosphodiester phosphodiesterase family protein [Leptospira ryugenii]|uniref:Glycerophosphodiester phosphodiesterase family protein n=1 Tax=Leptospira ryugenii TaxID=1917863 RepID=A0A2P2DXD1_9LEPT|nr:glycerophosphodiester phosphodiesterase family protein [Leptospira ryugenii]GBF49230.1 glycerophosphodiester phosphodiesterase family protein [Leptospira ryugenii]